MHDTKCTGHVAHASSAIVPTSTALVAVSSALKERGGAAGQAGSGTGAGSGSANAGKGASADGGGWGESPAQAALRTLGLDDTWPTDLTSREIRRRYMRQALQCHPDKGSAGEKAWRTAKFQELGEAYSILEKAVAVLERIRGGGGGDAFPESTTATPPGERCSATPAKHSDSRKQPEALPGGQLMLEAGQAAITGPARPASCKACKQPKQKTQCYVQ